MSLASPLAVHHHRKLNRLAVVKTGSLDAYDGWASVLESTV
jgi:hypothetical protein